jgi:adenylate kinase family enzyme
VNGAERRRWFVFLIGASGAGKTAVARELARRERWTESVFHFDQIGVPTPEVMERDFGGGERWQRWATSVWVRRLAERKESCLLLEGQTRPTFVLDAMDRTEIEPLFVLLECSPEERRRRLRARGQPMPWGRR